MKVKLSKKQIEAILAGVATTGCTHLLGIL